MKVLMVDVDGVLNSVQGFLRDRPDTPFYIQPELLGRFKKMMEQLPDVKIVLSSTWRKYKKKEEMEKILGVDILDYTPYTFSGSTRGHEISSWLEGYPSEGITLTWNFKSIFDFVILDDDDDMGNLKDHLVQTNREVGLSDSDVENVVGRLG